MGCDIHMCCEKMNFDGKWVSADFFKMNPYFGDDPGVSSSITVSGAFNIEDGSSNVVGNVNFSRYIKDTNGVAGDMYYQVGFNPIFIRLLGDGTADLYSRAYHIQNNAFGQILRR